MKLNAHKKKICATLAVAVILAISLAQVPKAYSAELTAQEKALSIIKDVVGLDVTKYNVELSIYISERPDEYGGLQREIIKYTLSSEGNKVGFVFDFVDKTFWRVDISPYNGSLLSAYYSKEIPLDTIDATKVILQRLQTYQDASYIQPMLDSMNAVTDINSANAIIGNIKREVNTYTDGFGDKTSTLTTISFTYYLNGADAPAKGVSIGFRDGALEFFRDGWGLFKIGSENMQISREEAISIAQEQANRASTSPLNFGNRPIRVDFKLIPREPFTLYPFWFIELPLEYPNSTITGWQVAIWADTGKIEYSHPTGILGTPPNTEGSSPDTQPKSENSENPPLSTYLIAATVIVVAFVATAAVILKKRHK